jgi:hypothetical protein
MSHAQNDAQATPTPMMAFKFGLPDQQTRSMRL